MGRPQPARSLALGSVPAGSGRSGREKRPQPAPFAGSLPLADANRRWRTLRETYGSPSGRSATSLCWEHLAPRSRYRTRYQTLRTMMRVRVRAFADNAPPRACRRRGHMSHAVDERVAELLAGSAERGSCYVPSGDDVGRIRRALSRRVAAGAVSSPARGLFADAATWSGLSSSERALWLAGGCRPFIPAGSSAGQRLPSHTGSTSRTRCPEASTSRPPRQAAGQTPRWSRGTRCWTRRILRVVSRWSAG